MTKLRKDKAHFKSLQDIEHAFAALKEREPPFTRKQIPEADAMHGRTTHPASSEPLPKDREPSHDH